MYHIQDYQEVDESFSEIYQKVSSNFEVSISDESQSF